MKNIMKGDAMRLWPLWFILASFLLILAISGYAGIG